jgi:hypothetical protein
MRGFMLNLWCGTGAALAPVSASARTILDVVATIVRSKLYEYSTIAAQFRRSGKPDDTRNAC